MRQGGHDQQAYDGPKDVTFSMRLSGRAPKIGEDSQMIRANLEKRPSEVAAMFDDVAAKYDRTNDVLSLRQDRRWRHLVYEAVGAQPGDTVLDIAAGTGTSSEPFADAGINVVPADFSLGMLSVGHRRRPDLGFTAADALRLPFADDSFDAVTMSFGLRNVVGTSEALEEFLRVTKPGGSLVICEFSHPRNKVFRKVYSNYLMRSLPPIARKISSNPDSYVYLAESIQAWPDQAGMAHLITRAGWQNVAWRNLSGGIVALHRAIKAPGIRLP
jgi:demethylmenaquinone methyltransferase/2-methoxy-6-polyprenyl-1,4-benzoquinol methylase